jgi:hypothetical protein
MKVIESGCFPADYWDQQATLDQKSVQFFDPDFVSLRSEKKQANRT